MSETKTVGTIGQMYENRKTGKFGTLVEINEKYKTLLMESPDGGTFNISFASLKSNWRKAKDDAVVQTETVESEPVEQTEPENPDSVNDNIVPIKKARKRSGKTNIELFTDLQAKAVEFLVDVDSPHLSFGSLNNHLGIALKIGRRRVVEMYAKSKTDSYRIFMSELFFGKTHWSESLNINPANVFYEESFVLTTYFEVPTSSLDTIFKDIKPTINDLIKEYIPKTIKTINNKED